MKWLLLEAQSLSVENELWRRKAISGCFIYLTLPRGYEKDTAPISRTRHMTLVICIAGQRPRSLDD